MATKNQIDKLYARIDALEVALQPRVKGCVIQMPDGWDEDKVWAQHCRTCPADVSSELVIFIRLFGPVTRPPGKEGSGNTEESLYDPDRRNGVERDITSFDGNGWRCFDDESWRVLARAESAAGRDPNVTLRQGQD